MITVLSEENITLELRMTVWKLWFLDRSIWFEEYDKNFVMSIVKNSKIHDLTADQTYRFQIPYYY
jgi:hypothetical protein